MLLVPGIEYSLAEHGSNVHLLREEYSVCVSHHVWQPKDWGEKVETDWLFAT